MTELDYFMPKSFDLKRARVRARLTQVELAELIGLTPNYYAILERGDAPLTRTVLIAMCAVLKLPIPKE